MTKDEIIKALRDMARYPTVTLPRDSEALKVAADLLAQSEQCQCPNCKVTLHASDCAVHSRPAYPKGECNCGATKPEQGPVAWMSPSWIDPDTRGWQSDSFESIPIEGWLPLYTTPPQRTWVHLTNQEHEEIAIDCGCLSTDWVFYGAAVERKVKEKNTI